MPRVYHVTLTKEFDCTILADSEDALEAALTECESDIDRDWDPPDWTWTIYDPLQSIKTASKVPKEIMKFDMAVVNGDLLSADEVGDLKLRIEAVKAQAEETLCELRLKLGLAEANAKLSFEDEKA